MRITSIYHSGVVVSDLDRAMAFYIDVLGLDLERGPSLSEGDWISSVVGYANVKMRQGYVGAGDGHSIELIEYVRPPGSKDRNAESRNFVGASHVGMIVDDIATWHVSLEEKGIRFFGPPALRNAEFPWAKHALYFQDPDGNWLEIVERAPRPPGAQGN